MAAGFRSAPGPFLWKLGSVAVSSTPGFRTRVGPPGIAGRNLGSAPAVTVPGWSTVVGPPVLIRFGTPGDSSGAGAVPVTPEEAQVIRRTPQGPQFGELSQDERDIMEILAIWTQIKDC